MLITDKVYAPVKELHGVNCAPYNKRAGDNQARIDAFFKYLGIPRSRLHDCCGSYGGTYFVDVPNIFRDFDADENNPENYDFHYSDEYIGAIIRSGAQIVYRLGVTIEWGSKKYTAHPPKDYAKWARICEHIIRHYNEGWCNGHNYGIEYWEIWNEPENPPMWTGTKEQFFELYKVASIYLKKCFPNIKIGGYGSSGMYAVFIEGMNDFYKSFPIWFVDFLEMVKREGCPLDFYSWHIYTDKLEHIIKSADFVREKLDEYGFVNTESHLNEWNYGAEGKQFEDKDTMVGASFIAAAFALMQKGSIDLAQYYVATQPSVYNGLLYMRTGEYTPVAHVFHEFNKMFRSDGALEIESTPSEPYAIAAKCGDTVRALISNYRKSSSSVTVNIPGKKIKVFGLCDGGFGKLFEADEKVNLALSSYTVYYIEAE
jgi:hypothetical protein